MLKSYHNKGSASPERKGVIKMATDKNIIEMWNTMTLEEKRQALAEYELRLKEDTAEQHRREEYHPRVRLVEIAD